MRQPLSANVALSMMVACLLTFVAPNALISISITLGCIFIDVYISVDGYPLTSNTSSSSSSLCATCALTDHYSTPSYSSNCSMFIGTTDVALGLACTLELQPLLHLHKNSIVNVLDLYIS